MFKKEEEKNKKWAGKRNFVSPQHPSVIRLEVSTYEQFGSISIRAFHRLMGKQKIVHFMSTKIVNSKAVNIVDRLHRQSE